MRQLKSAAIKGKKILVRTDFNVPLDKDNNVTQTSRIDAALDTIKLLLEKNAQKIILVTHLGRPTKAGEFSLAPVHKVLEKKLKKQVDFVANAKEAQTSDAQIVLIENIRQDPQENKGSITLTKELAATCDIYVNEAISNSHRRHASMLVPRYRPSYLGLHCYEEFKALEDFMKKVQTKKPVLAILGGKKLSTKLPLIGRFERIADDILLGGAMTYTVLKANGHEIGNSLHEDSMLKEAKKLLHKTKIHVPKDHVIKTSLKAKTVKVVKEIPKRAIGCDIGPLTNIVYNVHINDAKTIFWNGPPGWFEEEGCDNGTKELCKALKKSKADIYVAGGDTIAAAKAFKVTNATFFEGGGSSLHYISHKSLPAIDLVIKSQAKKK